ncbi:MAG TPA: hypothetical protein VGA04_12485 [Streptosporangiaceae bacterium]
MTIAALAAGPANAVILPPFGGNISGSGQTAGSPPVMSAAPIAVTPATVDVTTTKLRSIPASYYFGFSFESSETDLSNIFSTTGEYPALLKNLGYGVLRFGGNSVDRATFHGITASNLNSLAALVSATGWKVNYSENLGHYVASQVTSDAGAVSRKLGAHLLAFACGNEPEHFPALLLRPASYTEAMYLTEVAKCFAAIHAGAPGAPVSGPNTYHVAWLPPYAAAVKAGKLHVSSLDEQYYPMTHCGQTPTPGGSTTLLSRTTASNEAAQLNSIASSAAVAGTPFVLGETNSASCTGIPDMSNTYAAALWAVDWALLAAEKGATGIYFHGGLSTTCTSYTPICKTGPGKYVAEPVYYGLLFAHMLGSGQMLQTTISTRANIAAHAVTSGGKISVVVENLSATPSALTLNVPGVSGTASVLHLTGSSLAATWGVRIQGAALSPSGTITPGAATPVTCTAGVCKLTIAADSAVIVHLPA